MGKGDFQASLMGFSQKVPEPATSGPLLPGTAGQPTPKHPSSPLSSSRDPFSSVHAREREHARVPLSQALSKFFLILTLPRLPEDISFSSSWTGCTGQREQARGEDRRRKEWEKGSQAGGHRIPQGAVHSTATRTDEHDLEVFTLYLAAGSSKPTRSECSTELAFLDGWTDPLPSLVGRLMKWPPAMP